MTLKIPRDSIPKEHFHSLIYITEIFLFPLTNPLCNTNSTDCIFYPHAARRQQVSSSAVYGCTIYVAACLD
jgi:hypothetical protein